MSDQQPVPMADQLRQQIESMFSVGEYNALSKTRVQKMNQILSVGSKADVLDGALRLASKDEKAQGIAAPFVKDMASRMSVEAAGTLLSSLRTIAKAWYDNNFRFDVDNTSWDSLYSEARKSLKDARTEKAKERQTNAQGALIAKAIAEVGDSKDFARIAETAAKLQQEQSLKEAREAYARKILAIVDKIFSDKDVDDTVAFAQDVVTAINIRVDGAMRVRQQQAEKAAAPNVQTIPAQPDTATQQQAVNQ